MVALLTLCAMAPSSQAQPDPDPAVVTALADRILSCRHEASGVFLLDPWAEKRPAGFVPYFAHFAAYGLARAFEVTRKPEYLRATDAWVDWYGSHQRPDGTVTDYVFEAGGTLAPKDDMDSTDSYAAMYLWVVAERWRVAPEPSGWLRERELSCLRAVSAILLTLQEDGMTIAKPTYPIEYAMDNAEVVAGLRSAGLIFDALGNPGMAAHVRRLAERAEVSLRTLYSPEHGYFAWYRDLQGQMGFALDKWYPDVMAQVLVLMRVGRLGEPDQSVFGRVAQTYLTREFDSDRPSEHTWFGLAAQRVGNDEWVRKVVTPLNQLPAEAVPGYDSLRCSSILEAITGGTRPRW